MFLIHIYYIFNSYIGPPLLLPLCRGRHLRGAAYCRIYCFFKQKIVRLRNKMVHISPNLAFCRCEKYLGVKKDPGGGLKPIRKTENFFVGGGKKISRRHQMVTLRHCFILFIYLEFYISIVLYKCGDQ